MRKIIITIVFFIVCSYNFAATIVEISNPETWVCSDVSKYVGQTITFAQPFYICNNYYYNSQKYSISPQRIFAATNQAEPKSSAYYQIISHNNNSEVTLTGLSGYRRMGEMLYNLTVKITSAAQWSFVSADFVGNTREQLKAGIPDMDMLGEHSLLVCAFNLEYYLVENIGQDRGPSNATESARQHAKIMEALTTINADIYGFLEIERGQTALKKLANALTAATGRPYSYIDDGSTPYGTFTKSGYVYCSQTVEPVGPARKNQTAVAERKVMQAFKEKQTGETFIFSINHFKAKSGSGTGADADQGDGQGSFNATRVLEAQSVLSAIDVNSKFYGDEDVLIMGDLNAYAKEDPIRTMTDAGITDLHRYFHADSSYSYVYRQQAGYLDHALANEQMLKQITGMHAYHINSDEHDGFTYDKSTDQTMFRSSDHDPVLVGLRLGAAAVNKDENYDMCKITVGADQRITIHSAKNGFYRLYSISGMLITEGAITEQTQTLNKSIYSGVFFLNVYVEGQMKQFKVMIL